MAYILNTLILTLLCALTISADPGRVPASHGRPPIGSLVLGTALVSHAGNHNHINNHTSIDDSDESQGRARRDIQGGPYSPQGGPHSPQGGPHENQGRVRRDTQGGPHYPQGGPHSPQGGPHENQGRVRRDAQGGPNVDQGGVQENQGGAQENQGGAQENQGGAQENQGGAQENQGGAQENQGGAQENQGGAQENQGGAQENQSGAQKDQDGFQSLQDVTNEREAEDSVSDNINKIIGVPCNAAIVPRLSCLDCTTRMICKPSIGILISCNNRLKPYCNRGLCSSTPGAECAAT